MSGITGILRLSDDAPLITPETLQGPMAAIAAYGGDDSAIWHDDHAALGQQTLWVTQPHKQGVQSSADGRYYITFDGRLDDSDTQADENHAQKLLACLHDATRLQQLNGEFAFAIYDSAEHKLLLARDHIGARPLYYARSKDTFVFGTDIGALLAYPGVSHELDEAVVAAYLLDDDFTLTGQTFYRDVWKLPHAHYLNVTPQRFELHCYWRPEDTQPIHCKTLTDYAELLRERVSQAVAWRVRTSYPVAAHISGGLDSSSVAVLAARHVAANNDIFAGMASWSPPYDDIALLDAGDERPRIDAMAAAENADVLYTRMDGHKLRAFLQQDISRMGWVSLSIEPQVLQQVQARGARVLLSGWGGDEAATTNAKGLLAELLLRGRWLALLRDLRDLTGWRRAALRAELRRELPSLLPTLIAGRDDSGALPPYIAPDFAQRTDQQRLERVTPYRAARFRRVRSVRQSQFIRIRRGHISVRMEAWAIAGAQHGVLYSYPLTDRRVLEAAFSIPTEYYLQQGIRRYIFRVAMQGILPDETRWHTSKYDAALEVSRRRMRLQLWRMLADEVAVGLWADDVPWLDMPRVRAHLSAAPQQMTREYALRLLQLRRAIVAYHLWQIHMT